MRDAIKFEPILENEKNGKNPAVYPEFFNRLRLMNILQIVRHLLWTPGGLVPSLESLNASHGVTVKQDVTMAVSGSKEEYPLTVAELVGGKIIGDLRMVATAGDVVVGGLQRLFGCPDPQNHSLMRRWRFRMLKRRRGTALLLGVANSDNYYHWLVESVPRWKILQAANWLNYDYVLLHSKPSRFQEEVLDRLNVPPAKRLRCSKNFVHQFERLVVPSMPFPPEQMKPWACAYVRSLFLGSLDDSQIARPGHEPEFRDIPRSDGVPICPSPLRFDATAPTPGAKAGKSAIQQVWKPALHGGRGPEKIYLRRGPGRRVLSNEAELEAALERIGFVALSPQHLTVIDQARLLSSARVVVAPHGAALTNLLFAPPGTRFLEIFHPQHKNGCFTNIAAVSGHRYASLDGSCDDRSRKGHLIYAVDVAAVLKILEREGYPNSGRNEETKDLR